MHLPTIRSETSFDTAAIHAVHLAAFPTPAEAELVDRLRDGGRLVVSLVAESEGEIVGQLAFSSVTLDPKVTAEPGLGLAPVAVLPGRQRAGIGQALIENGIAACRAAGYAFVVVLGAPDYYRRFGFQTASSFGLGNAYGVDAEFMALELKPGTFPLPPCTVHYAPEFAELT